MAPINVSIERKSVKNSRPFCFQRTKTIHELIAPSRFFSTREELKPRKQQRAFSPQQRRGFNDIKIGFNGSGCADVLEQATVTTRLTLHWN
ncbi:hypothetical protein NPIL_654111 [Nephila pilipes]|uniref:Uncharacterized protein n=1 Tax=Nephila pilipes TaxID=299642 RepID=A0A8X6I3T8_NEPPI|nr:hypothetical protein NPIL_654111 [Nephila pilipes]